MGFGTQNAGQIAGQGQPIDTGTLALIKRILAMVTPGDGPYGAGNPPPPPQAPNPMMSPLLQNMGAFAGNPTDAIIRNGFAVGDRMTGADTRGPRPNAPPQMPQMRAALPPAAPQQMGSGPIKPMGAPRMAGVRGGGLPQTPQPSPLQAAIANGGNPPTPYNNNDPATMPVDPRAIPGFDPTMQPGGLPTNGMQPLSQVMALPNVGPLMNPANSAANFQGQQAAAGGNGDLVSLIRHLLRRG